MRDNKLSRKYPITVLLLLMLNFLIIMEKVIARNKNRKIACVKNYYNIKISDYF